MAEQVNKFQRDLGQTENTFKFQPELDQPKAQKNIVRAEQTRRDNDVVKGPNADLYQIDYNIKWYLENVIKPTVSDAGRFVDVPVMYASPEKWSSIQRQGFMRDDKGKIMTPVIAFSRTSLDSRADMPKNKVFHEEENRIRFSTKYTKQNKYDKFSVLYGQIPQEEYYTVHVPDYINVNYDFIIWCDYIEQLNKVVEKIVYYQGMAWGDTYKYMTKVDAHSFETANNQGEDRISRATFSLKAQAYIINNELSDRPAVEKHHSRTKVVLGEGTYDPNNPTQPVDNRRKSTDPNLHN
jgi:hypothetical protein